MFRLPVTKFKTQLFPDSFLLPLFTGVGNGKPNQTDRMIDVYKRQINLFYHTTRISHCHTIRRNRTGNHTPRPDNAVQMCIRDRYQIARNGWIADYNDPISFLDMWVTGGGNNDAQYSNADYDAAIAEAKASSDPQVRMDAMHRAEDIIMDQDWALGPIYFYTQKYMINSDISGMYYTCLLYTSRCV